MENRTWIAFARRDYQEPLTQIGAFELPEGAPVREAAAKEFGEQWLELVVVPRHRMSWAIREV